MSFISIRHLVHGSRVCLNGFRGLFDAMQFNNNCFFVSFFFSFLSICANLISIICTFSVPMKLSSQHLRPLPKDLQDLKANSYTVSSCTDLHFNRLLRFFSDSILVILNIFHAFFQGGLAKCVPIEKVRHCFFSSSFQMRKHISLSNTYSLQRLNYASLKHETHDVDDFPEYLVANAKQTIDEAAEIFFVPRQTIGHQIFGDIAITKFCGTKIDLLSELVTTDSVKVCDRIIPKGDCFRN